MPRYNVAPGQQNASKYPFVGPNYNRLGEQTGYIYDPYSDKYKPDPKIQGDYYQNSGLAPKQETPKDPSLASTLLPIAGVGLAIEGGREIGKGIPGAIKDAWNGTGTSTAPTQATQGVAPAPVVNQPAGLFAGAGTPGGAASTGSTANVGLDTFAPKTAPTAIGAGEAVPTGYTAIGSSADGGQLIAPSDAVATGGVDYAQVGQGALGAFQLYQAYQSYKDGDKLGAGIQGAAGLAGLGASLAGETAAGQLAAEAVPILGPVAGAYGAYQTSKMIGSAPSGGQRNSSGAMGGAGAGAAIGATIGSVVPGAGTAIGAGIGALVGAAAGLAGSYFGSHKGSDQVVRDGWRKYAKNNGLLTEDYKGTLADGSTFDFGKDGKKYGKVDFNQPNFGELASFANTIAAAEGLTGKSQQSVVGLYVNAANSNANGDLGTGITNLQHFAQQRGFNTQNVSEQLNKLHDEGRINDNEFAVYSSQAARFLPPPGQGAPVVAPAKPVVTQTPVAANTPVVPVAKAPQGMFSVGKSAPVQQTSAPVTQPKGLIGLAN